MGRSYSMRCGGWATGLWPWLYDAGLVGVALLAGCASDRPPPHAHRGARPPGEGAAPARPALFVSPCGEPFRARPGEPYPVAVWFRQADADGDGRLSRDEFVADAARFFRRVDANGDGVIDGMELKVYETDIVPEISQDRGVARAGAGQGGASPDAGGAGPRGGRRGGGRRQRGMGGVGGGQQGAGGGGFAARSEPQADGAAPYGLLAEREPVAGADLDLNGRITLANFQARATQRFVRLDAMGRGYLVLADLPKTQVQLRAARREQARGG